MSLYIASSLNTQNELLMKNLMEFYKNSENLNRMMRIINGESKISLRIVDWFVTNYSKKQYTVYSLDGGSTRFKVYNDYKLKLKAYSKKRFDPFCRWERITIPYDTEKFMETTIGQLNFFKWAIENKIIDLRKTQEKITASELLSQRMVIVNTELASAQAVVLKELAYNKNPDNPYVVMVDARSAEQILSDSKPAATSESKSSMVKTTISMEASEQQAILALRQKLGTTNIYGLTIKKQETFDDIGRRIYIATATGVAVPIPTDLMTVVKVTYKNQLGDIITDTRAYSGSTYLSQSQAAAATLAEFKSIKNTKVLGLAVVTRNTNTSSTNTNGIRLNTHNN
jgi:hypothetical protein